jgi:DNA-binding NtrC family response regulator
MRRISRKVLIVDDEANIRQALQRLLHGCQVFTASNADVALRILEREEMDVLITDHRMPGMTGLDLVRFVRGRWPKTLRMMLTGQTDVRLAMDAINQGEMYRFLMKPWDDLELKLEVHFAFERIALMQSNEQYLDSTHPLPYRT